MNPITVNQIHQMKTLAAAATVALLLAACASAPQSPPGSAEVRAKLTQLQNDTDLASRAPLEIKEAEAAVRLAEMPVPKDKALGTYRVYVADHSVDIATAKATTRYTEDQRVLLSKQRESAQLAARTREADQARREANLALSESERARADAEAARLAKERALAEAADAASLASQEAAELQRQIALLQAEATDRGIVLTLGNVLFATARSELKPNATDSLNKLVAFLNQYPDRKVAIEGHTDSVGSDASNQALSQRRADSVRSYLIQQGISAQRISAIGRGENYPIGDNNTETGRQVNRRVEVIIENPPPLATS